MNRSPLIGLSSTCPLNAMESSSAIRPGAGPLVVARAVSMVGIRRRCVVGPQEALALRPTA
jgi:hypothetical protein